MFNLTTWIAACAAALLAPVAGSVENMPGIEDRIPLVAQADSADAAARQLLVRFDDNVSASRIDEINRRLGAVVINRMSEGRLLLVEVPYAAVLNDIQAAYAATEGVRYAEPNQTVTTPPDPDAAVPEDGPSIPKDITIEGEPN